MKFLKINNLTNAFGQADYKGLDLNFFVSGSQTCSRDFASCVIATDEEIIPQNADLIELTQAEYISEKSIMMDELQEKTEIELLRNELSTTKAAVDFLLASQMPI